MRTSLDTSQYKTQVSEFITCNVTNTEQMQDLIPQTIKTFGRLDVMINNAGIAEPIPFTADKQHSWKKVIDIDLSAVILGTQLAMDHFTALNQSGVIVNCGSLAGLYVQGLQPVYAAAKSGVVHFTRSIAAGIKLLNLQDKIRVNVVCPTFTQTGMLDHAKRLMNVSDNVLDIAPLEWVVDGFMKAVEDVSLNGEIIRITGKHKVDVFKPRL